MKKTDNKKKYYNAITIIAVIIAFGVLLFLVSNSAKKAPSQPSNIKNPLTGIILNANSLMETDYILGSASAPVTIVQFSDFECPFCSRFHRETFPLIESTYIERGLVKFVHRDFPLGIHPNAKSAALAAECAGEQGKYWEMHDALYMSGVSGEYKAYKMYAENIKLDLQIFEECYNSGKYNAEIQKDASDGSIAGVTGTPAFFVGEQFISGAQPYNVFDSAIKKELDKLGIEY